MHLTHNIVENKVLVPFLRKQFDGESSNIPERISGSRTRSHGGHPNESFALPAHPAEEVGRGQVGDIMGHLEFSPGAGSVSMNHSGRDSLPAEVCEGLDELSIG